MKPKHLRLLVFDDNKLFRDGLKLHLKEFDNTFFIVLEASSQEEVTNKTADYQLDVIIIDYKMLELWGIECYQNFKSYHPHTRSMLLIRNDAHLNVPKLIEAGFSCFVSRNSAHNDLIEAIYTTLQGDPFVSNSLKHKFIPNINFPKLTGDRKNLFSKKELEIISMICKQMTTKEIANNLYLSVRTIEDYSKAIKTKTGSRNIVGIALFAVENGLF